MSDANEILQRGEAARSIADQRLDAYRYLDNCLRDLIASAELKLAVEAWEECEELGCTEHSRIVMDLLKAEFGING